MQLKSIYGNEVFSMFVFVNAVSYMIAILLGYLIICKLMGRKELQVMSSNQSVNEFLDEMEFKRDAEDFSVNEDSVEAYEYNLMLKGDMIGMYDESDMNRVAEGIEEEDDEFMEPDEIEEIDSKMAL
jgi:hypothetical protein